MTRMTQGAHCHAQSRVGTLWMLGLLLSPDRYPADSGVQTTDRCSSASCGGVGRMLTTGCPKEHVGSTRRGCQRSGGGAQHEAGGGNEFFVPARAFPSMQAGPSRGSAATAACSPSAHSIRGWNFAPPSPVWGPPASAASGAWTSGGVFPSRAFCFQRRKHGQIHTVFFQPDS